MKNCQFLHIITHAVNLISIFYLFNFSLYSLFLTKDDLLKLESLTAQQPKYQKIIHFKVPSNRQFFAKLSLESFQLNIWIKYFNSTSILDHFHAHSITLLNFSLAAQIVNCRFFFQLFLRWMIFLVSDLSVEWHYSRNVGPLWEARVGMIVSDVVTYAKDM